MIKGFFSNKFFFLFAGLFVLVTVAYLFADGGMGAFHKGLKGFYCTPEDDSCAGGIHIVGAEDQCTLSGILFWKKCQGECEWCEPSSDKGRYCLEKIEYSGECVVPIPPPSTMSCGPRRKHECDIKTGRHGPSGCCPPKDMTINPGPVCDNLSNCE